MPYLRFTILEFYENETYCSYTASVAPGFEKETIEPILELLSSFHGCINSFKSKQHRSSKCTSYEFDNPNGREDDFRTCLIHTRSKDELHIALVEEMRSLGWQWIDPNEIWCHSINRECTTTWTFKRYS
ncbi:unnamed protein product [Clavelina lepadiformis]|uniref:Uncharacterized protein n=1 Tax=Clavelina lepadiformis TaxID=159417 RepID=A0ABP0G1Y2_CLALP